MTDPHPAPPSAPASAGDAGFEAKIARIRNYHMRGTETDIVNDRPVEVPVCSCGHHPDDCEVRVVLDVLDAAQRQHAAEVERLTDTLNRERREAQSIRTQLHAQARAALAAAQREAELLRANVEALHRILEEHHTCGQLCPVCAFAATDQLCPVCARCVPSPAAPPAAQMGPAYRLAARIERPPLTLPADDCHAMGHAEPPPADADALREDR